MCVTSYSRFTCLGSAERNIDHDKQYEFIIIISTAESLLTDYHHPLYMTMIWPMHLLIYIYIYVYLFINFGTNRSIVIDITYDSKNTFQRNKVDLVNYSSTPWLTVRCTSAECSRNRFDDHRLEGGASSIWDTGYISVKAWDVFLLTTTLKAAMKTMISSSRHP